MKVWNQHSDGKKRNNIKELKNAIVISTFLWLFKNELSASIRTDGKCIDDNTKQPQQLEPVLFNMPTLESKKEDKYPICLLENQ